MFTPSFNRVLSEGKGWLPIGLFVGGSFALTMVWFIPYWGVLLGLIIRGKDANPEGLVSSLIVIVVVGGLATLIATPFLWGGLLGSWRDALSGNGPSLSLYWTNGKALYWKSLGNGILFTLAAGVLGIAVLGLTFLPAVGSGSEPSAGWIVGGVLLDYAVVLIAWMAVLVPLMILSISGYPAFLTLRRHWRALTLRSLLALFLMMVPLANMLAQPLYALYVESLAYEDHLPPAEAA